MNDLIECVLTEGLAKALNDTHILKKSCVLLGAACIALAVAGLDQNRRMTILEKKQAEMAKKLDSVLEPVYEEDTK